MAAIDALVLAAEGAKEAPNPLLPAPADLLWGSVCFVIFFLIFWKYVLPQLRKALDERTAGIELKLEKAEADRAEAQSLLEQYREQLADARQEAARIRAEAQSDRQAIVDEARGEAQAAATQVTERAQAQLASDRAQAKAELSREVGRIAVELAEKVVGAALADTAATRATVDRFLDELDAQTGSGSTAGRR